MFHCSFATENIAFRGAVTGLAGLMAGSALMALAARPAQAQVVIRTANATTAVTSVTAVTAASASTLTRTISAPPGVLAIGSTRSTVAAAALGLTPCQPSGKGRDFPVGPGLAYTTLDQVPWESLKAGDTVRIHPAPTPYRGKFAIVAQGTADAPVLIPAGQHA